MNAALSLDEITNDALREMARDAGLPVEWWDKQPSREWRELAEFARLARAYQAPTTPAPATAITNSTWMRAEAMAVTNLAVKEALEAFAEDQTGDNAVGIVAAVLDATLTRDLQASAPAPWEVSFHKTVTGKPFGIVTGGQPGNGRMDIVICYGPDAYDEPLSFKAFLANAPLIAAAPKLLAALELIANAENSALDLAYCKGVARAAIGASATTSR